MVESENEAKTEIEDVSKIEWGEALSLEMCYPISASDRTLFIILAGPSNAGKTTFLINLFDLFQQGTVGDYAFAGSRTLIGYERRLSIFRYADFNHVPETQRTPDSTEPEILHIRVARVSDPTEKVNILVGDISGELFKAARDSAQIAGTLTFLKAADVIVFFADAEPMQSANNIGDGLSDARLIARRFLQMDLLSKDCVVQAVLSRVDLLGEDVDEDDVLQQITTRVLELAKEKGHYTREPVAIQCEPLGDSKGVVDLFQSWLEVPEIKEAEELEQPVSYRYFQRFRVATMEAP